MSKNLFKIEQCQIDIFNELNEIGKKETTDMKSLLYLPSLVLHIIVEDWRNYTILEKAVFLIVMSPLVHLFLHF